MKVFALLLLLAAGSVAGAQAPAERLPDLVVTDVQTLPAHPQAGDVVTLRAVVKNRGTAPTPDGVVLGGVFRLDGSPIAFEDQYRHSLAPGESVTLTANGGGGTGDGTWTAKVGTYRLGFLVDDINRIKKSRTDDTSFTLPQPLVIAKFDGPRLVLRRLTWTPAAPRPGQPVTFHVAVANTGTQPWLLHSQAYAGVTIDGRSEGGVAGRFPRAALPPGGTETVSTVAARLTPGKHHVAAGVTTVFSSGSIASNDFLTWDLWVDAPLGETAKPADAFADSVGVCTHFSYFDTTYGQYGLVKRRLVQSGIRYIRDGASPGGGVVLDRLNDLAASGVRTCLLMGPDQVPVEKAVGLAAALRPALAFVEGPNEPNLFYASQFPDGIRDYQNKLYVALKADPRTKNLPVLSPALAFPGEIATRLGPVSCDFGAMHPYPGGQLPDAGLDGTIRATKIVSPTQPLIITETGYDTAVHVTSGQPAVSEAAEAKYAPRLLLETFNRGVPHTFLYEFADEHPEPAMHEAEQHFGLVRADGTPKPAYSAIQALIRLLSDRGKSFAPGALRCTVSGDATDLHHTLLQKRDGHFFLVLWVNARSYDQDAKADVAVPPHPVTLRFARPFARAVLYRPSQSPRPLRAYGYASALTLDVPDEPLVVELTPGK